MLTNTRLKRHATTSTVSFTLTVPRFFQSHGSVVAVAFLPLSVGHAVYWRIRLHPYLRISRSNKPESLIAREEVLLPERQCGKCVTERTRST